MPQKSYFSREAKLCHAHKSVVNIAQMIVETRRRHRQDSPNANRQLTSVMSSSEIEQRALDESEGISLSTRRMTDESIDHCVELTDERSFEHGGQLP